MAKAGSGRGHPKKRRLESFHLCETWRVVTLQPTAPYYEIHRLMGWAMEARGDGEVIGLVMRGGDVWPAPELDHFYGYIHQEDITPETHEAWLAAGQALRDDQGV